MATAKTPAGNVVGVAVTAEHGTARHQTGNVTFGGLVVGYWSQAGSLPTLAAALVRADETIAALGLQP